FRNQYSRHQRHAGNVPAWPCQASNYAGFDRVGRDDDNGDFTCCLLCGQCAGNVERHDYIDLEPDQLRRKFGQSLQLSFRRAKLKRDVLPFHITKFTESFPEFLLEGFSVCEAYVERAYSSHL